MKKLKNEKNIKIKNAVFLIVCLFGVLYSINQNENEIFASKNDPLMLIPSGQAASMKLKTNGVMVVGTENNMPARRAKINVGDIITKANDVNVLNTNHFEDIVAKSQGETLTLTLMRNNEEIKTKINAEKNESGQYVMGLWIRDSASGIGTISFFSADKKHFFALGHPVNDNDTNMTYDVRKGELGLVDIRGAKRGEKNNPGELLGTIEDGVTGNILKNTPSGITGTLTSSGIVLEQPMPVSPKNEVKLGKAYIMSTVSEKGTGKYEIEIIKILNGEDNKDFIIKVTDEALIEQTGGIVRGMSGSPIIRDGKIIGAVTHVMVSDPKKGFAISAEHMISP